MIIYSVKCQSTARDSANVKLSMMPQGPFVDCVARSLVKAPVGHCPFDLAGRFTHVLPDLFGREGAIPDANAMELAAEEIPPPTSRTNEQGAFVSRVPCRGILCRRLQNAINVQREL